MTEYLFEIKKCKSNYVNRLDEKDWYHRKCMYTAWGHEIVANHGYNKDELSNPIDFEKIAEIAHKSTEDFKYVAIGNNANLSMTEVFALSFNKSIEAVKKVEDFVENKYFNHHK